MGASGSILVGSPWESQKIARKFLIVVKLCKSLNFFDGKKTLTNITVYFINFPCDLTLSGNLRILEPNIT